jgi:hypothetical protein
MGTGMSRASARHLEQIEHLHRIVDERNTQPYLTDEQRADTRRIVPIGAQSDDAKCVRIFARTASLKQLFPAWNEQLRTRSNASESRMCSCGDRYLYQNATGVDFLGNKLTTTGGKLTRKQALELLLPAQEFAQRKNHTIDGLSPSKLLTLEGTTFTPISVDLAAKTVVFATDGIAQSS